VAVVTGAFQNVQNKYEEEAKIIEHNASQQKILQNSRQKSSKATPRSPRSHGQQQHEKDPRSAASETDSANVIVGAAFGNKCAAPEIKRPAVRHAWGDAAVQNNRMDVREELVEDMVEEEMDEQRASRLKDDVQGVLDSPAWSLVYNTVIISQTVLLAFDRWDTPLVFRNVLFLYYGFAQVFFLIELGMLWLTLERDEHFHFSQIVPFREDEKRAGPEAGDEDDDQIGHQKVGSQQDENTGRAIVLTKVLLLVAGLLGLMTRQHAWTHVQALRIFWPAIKALPVLESLLLSSLKALLAIANFLTFVLLLMICWAEVGRYVFGDSLASVSRSHFADLASGMLTLFQLFTGDSWTTVLYQLLESQDGNQYRQVCACTPCAEFPTHGDQVAANGHLDLHMKYRERC